MEPSDSLLPTAKCESRLLSPSSISLPTTASLPQSASSSRLTASTAQPQPCPPSSSKMSPTIYPPTLPPPYFFDLELEAEKLKDMFKVSNSLKTLLYDEIDLVNLPADEKGNLILDPESRTKMVDVEVEFGVLYEYMLWMNDVKEKGVVGEHGEKWLEGLREAVNEDFGQVLDEWLEVADEERGKKGLSDRHAHWGAYKGQIYDAAKKEWRRVEQKTVDGSSQEERDSLSRSPTLKGDDDELIAPKQPRVDCDASQTEIETSPAVLSPRDIVEDKAPLPETLKLS